VYYSPTGFDARRQIRVAFTKPLATEPTRSCRCLSRAVPKLGWFELDAQDPAIPIDWRWAALTTATLFLNLFFWYAHSIDLWMSSRLPVYAALIAAAAVLVAALFFIGPALATHRARKPLFDMLADSFGSVIGYALRACCVVFLLAWISSFFAFLGFFQQIVSPINILIIAGVILSFLFFTGLQSPRVNATMATFTNKLGFAILIAALLRVRHGWPMVWNGLPGTERQPLTASLWQGVSLLAYDLAPLSLFAAGLGSRVRERRYIVATAFTGIVLPLFGVLLLMGIINVAIFSSGFYQPSLNPNVGMALFSGAARSAVPGRLAIAAITTFGAARFGVRSLTDVIAFRSFGKKITWALLAGLGLVILWCSMHPYDTFLAAAFETSALVLTVAGAVLCADLITGRTQMARSRTFDWIGATALGVGALTSVCGAFFVAIANPYWHPWLLPSFGMVFLVALAGGTIQRLAARAALDRTDRQSRSPNP
jgi:FtsH-binding integral membrane protein